MVEYALVLSDYGGDTEKGRARYRKQLVADLGKTLEVKDDIFGQAIIGNGDFIEWVTERFLVPGQAFEQPSINEIRRYRSRETILSLLATETGKDLVALKNDKGDLRRLAMDILYRHGGLKGPEIGELFGVGYSAVSQERKRLRQSLSDWGLAELRQRLEDKLSTMKSWIVTEGL